MEIIAKITAVNGWTLAALGFVNVFFVLSLLLCLIALLMKYTSDREKRAADAARPPLPAGMKTLSNMSYNEEDEASLSDDYREFLASLKSGK